MLFMWFAKTKEKSEATLGPHPAAMCPGVHRGPTRESYGYGYEFLSNPEGPDIMVTKEEKQKECSARLRHKNTSHHYPRFLTP